MIVDVYHNASPFQGGPWTTLVARVTTKLRLKFYDDWREYTRSMKRLGASLKTLDEYVLYRLGSVPKGREGRVKDPMRATTHRRESPSVPSGEGVGQTYARPEKRYTGDYIKGVVVLHKSNLVPVTSREQAVDAARMRRS